MSRRVAAPVVDIFACLFSVQERTPPSRAWRVGFATRANINFTDRVYGSKMVCVLILKIPGAMYPHGDLSTLERRLTYGHEKLFESCQHPRPFSWLLPAGGRCSSGVGFNSTFMARLTFVLPLCFTLRAHRLVQGDCLSVSGGVGDSRARERQNGEKGGADLGIAGMRRRWGGGLQGS